MKKIILNIILCCAIFIFVGCSCKEEKTIKKEEAMKVLKETKINGNVEVKTTTETIINNLYSSSTQTDIYYGDKYLHMSEANDLTTKTWYGSINNTLYAFYYTKNANDEEIKSSSRIERTLLESTKSKLNDITNSLFDEDGKLVEGYAINATKKGNVYTIAIDKSNVEENNSYIITIQNNKILKIVNENTINDTVIKTTYEYNYDVREFEVPSLNEYPLKTNG